MNNELDTMLFPDEAAEGDEVGGEVARREPSLTEADTEQAAALRRQPGGSHPAAPVGRALARRDDGEDDWLTIDGPDHEFEHWPEIRQAVQDAYVVRSSVVGAEAARDPQAFRELVTGVVNPHPAWCTPVQLPMLVAYLSEALFGYRGLERYLALPEIEDIMFNRFDEGWVQIGGHTKRIIEPLFASEDDLVAWLQQVADEAQNRSEINTSKPIFDGTLADGSRIAAVLPPVARRGALFVIRKPPARPFTIEELTEYGTLTADAAETLRKLIEGGWNICVSGGTSSGKAHPYGTRVLTPNGWKPIEQLSLSDRVIGRDGKPHHVIGVYERGVKPIYKVTLNDGASVECCDEHLWSVRSRKDANRANGYRVMELREIAANLADQGGCRWFIPMVEPVEFDPPSEELTLDPYLLGALLGDGGLHQSAVFTSADQEMLDVVSSLLPTGLALRKTGNGYDYRISTGCRGIPNPVLDALRELGLHDSHSHDKFIPERYLCASAEDRLALLQGLCDTDGTVAADSSDVEFSTTSPALVRGVQELVWSLGGTARFSERRGRYTYLGERRTARISYRVRIKLPAPLNPFRLARKAGTYRPCTYRPCTRGIKTVEYVADKPAICIAVDASDQLYVTEDFIVTHNTALVNALMSAYLPRGDRLAVIEDTPEIKLPNQPNIIFYGTRKGRSRADQVGAVTMRDAIESSLRVNPDRILIGEVRGAETYDAMVAWNSGHEGSALTVHANSAARALTKLEQLARSAGELDQEAIRDLLGSTVNIIVQVMHVKGRRDRLITEIVQVIHPYELDPDAAEEAAELRAQGKLRMIWGEIGLYTLYRREGGELRHIAEPLPVVGRTY